MAEQPKISVKNLTKKFDDLTVLDDISFNIKSVVENTAWQDV